MMKHWFSQNKKNILFAVLLGIFVLQVQIVPSIRPFFYERRNYYVTYRIDGNNIADAVVFIPAAFMAMGFFTTILKYPSRFRTALYCALVPLPVVLRRMVCWKAYTSVLDNALYNICSFALGIMLAVFVRFVTVCGIRLLQNSWHRYREKKNGQQDFVPLTTVSADAFSKPRLCDRICAMVTHDTMLYILSAAVPLMLSVLYSASIAQTSPVESAQDEIDMTYMLFVLPFGYLASGLLCAHANKPQYFTCGAALVLVSLDTIYGVFDIREFPDLSNLVIAAVIYLVFFGIGIVIGRGIRRCSHNGRAM